MSSATPNTSEQDALLRAGIDRSLRHPVMFFMTSGAAWLAVSIVLGIISSAKVHSPEFLSSSSWLTYGRVFPAHINALIYGWGFQAAFAVIIWMMARLSRKECTAAGLILAAGHVWNLGVSLGLIGRVASLVSKLFCHRHLVIHSVSGSLGRTCIHFPMVYPRSNNLVSMGIHHGKYATSLLARSSGDGCWNQCLVQVGANISFLHASGSRHGLLFSA